MTANTRRLQDKINQQAAQIETQVATIDRLNKALDAALREVKILRGRK